jgi:predicted transcriptional regulator
MTRKTATPQQITEMLALREAGYTALAISQKLGLSVRTVHRYLSAHGAKKGRLKAEAIQQARNELFQLVTSSPAIREASAKLVADDLAHANHIRAIMIEAAEHLKAESLSEAALVMRAAAAYSTAVKNTSDMMRHSLGADKIADDVDDLPELVVRELTSDEIAEMVSKRDTVTDDLA